MRLQPISGKYVVAVSGGVDSVVLLYLLNKMSQAKGDLTLIVAHFDHGIRKDSSVDKNFVKQLAASYGLKFYSEDGHLGASASEQRAREARYEFLNKIVKKEQASGLVTAHHQDDLIETAIINIIRGTGRKGLSSLSSDSHLLRPLLGFKKTEIVSYGLSHKLSWREDPTNKDVKYLRNYLRLEVVPRLSESSRQKLLNLIKKQAVLNSQIDKELTNILNLKAIDNQLPRLWLNSLDRSLSGEILAAWLRANGLPGFDRPTIERLDSHLKTVSPKKQVDVLSGWRIVSTRDNLALKHVER